MNKFEKLIEYIINDEDQKARELFHAIVVEKSREIYESIMDEEGMEETVAGNQVENMVDEIGAEEAQTMEDSEEEGEDDGDAVEGPGGEMDDEMPADDAGEFDGGDEVAGDEVEHQEIEDQVMSIDAKLDELLAKFDQIVGGDDDMGQEEMPGADMGAEMGAEEPMDAEMDEMGMMEAEDKEDCDDEDEKSDQHKDDKKAKTESRKSTAEIMREYVDRIGDIYGGAGDASEGDAVAAAGKKAPINSKSIVGPGADFGGNVVKRTGADNENPDGKPTPKANNEYTKGQGVIKSGNRNVPGGNAGSPQSTGKEYSKAPEGAEGQTTGGKVPVATKSVQKQNTGKK